MAARDQTVTPWGVSFQYTVDSEQMTLQTLQDATCERALPHRGACIGLALAPRRPVFPNAGTLFTSLGPAMQSGKSHLLSQPNVPIYTHSVNPKYSHFPAFTAAGTFGFIYIFRRDLMTHCVVRRQS